MECAEYDGCCIQDDTVPDCLVCVNGALINDTTQDAQSCDDDDDATDSDTCVLGECVGVPTCVGLPAAPPCYECIARVYILDDSQGGCDECHACYNGTCNATAADGDSCDDGDGTTFRDMCNNGTCVGSNCTLNCFNDASHPDFSYPGCLIQDNTVNACCEVGNCTQTNATEPTCQGGGCDQTNGTDCVCLGPGACPQFNCTDPVCPMANCPGNCDNMDCGDCQYCDLGYCYANTTLDGQICDDDGDLVDAVCDNGECVGTPSGCFTDTGQFECTSCEMCDMDTEQCVTDPSKEGNSCLDGYGGTGTCEDGICTPAFEILDQIVVNFGLQESDANSGHAKVTLGGLVRVRLPWEFVDNPGEVPAKQNTGEGMGVVSNWPVAEEPGAWVDFDGCAEDSGLYCTQSWTAEFTVEKVCDIATTYGLEFMAKNRNIPEDSPNFRLETYWYQVTIAQKAVCGVVIRDVPLQGGIDVCVDPQCSGPTQERVFRLGAKVPLHAWFSGLAPIEHYDVTEMYFQIADYDPKYVITEPPNPQQPIDQVLVDAVNGDCEAECILMQLDNNPCVFEWDLPQETTTGGDIASFDCQAACSQTPEPYVLCKEYFQDITAFTDDAADGSTLKWYAVLANSEFAVTVAEFFKIALDVRVRYLQGRRRQLADGSFENSESEYYYYFWEKEIMRSGKPTGEIAQIPYFYSPKARRYLQTPEEEFNYQFDHEFTVVPFRCTSEHDAWGVEVGSYAATPCDNGENLFMRYCDTNGWNDELNKNLCGEVVVPGETTVEEEASASGGMLWLLVIVNACAFVLICSICFLICDRYRRKKARVKVVAMPDNKKPFKNKSSAGKGGEGTRPKVAAEVSVKDGKKPVEHQQLFE